MKCIACWNCKYGDSNRTYLICKKCKDHSEFEPFIHFIVNQKIENIIDGLLK